MYKIYRDTRGLLPDVVTVCVNNEEVQFYFSIDSEYLTTFQQWLEAGNSAPVVYLNEDAPTFAERLEMAELFLGLLLDQEVTQ